MLKNTTLQILEHPTFISRYQLSADEGFKVEIDISDNLKYIQIFKIFIDFSEINKCIIFIKFSVLIGYIPNSQFCAVFVYNNYIKCRLYILL